MSAQKSEKTTAKREAWGRLRKLPSGRWQARYPGPDGEMHTARTDDDKPLTFLTKTDARTWLSGVHTKIARDLWEPSSVVAARRRAKAEADEARAIGFTEYAERWIEMIRTRPGRSGKKRSAGTVRAYKSKITGYLIPEFGVTPVRTIDIARIHNMTDRLDQIPSPLNPNSKFNGISQPVLIVLMMILRQAARDGIINKAPDISIPKQSTVRHDADHDPGEDVASPEQVEELHEAVPALYAVMPLFAAWCQLRRGECLGLQRRDIEWHDDGSATLHVRRQMNANTGDYTDLKSDAGKRSLSIPEIMFDRLREHLRINVAPDAKAPVFPTSPCGSVPLSNTKWWGIWAEARDAVTSLPPRFRFHDLRYTGLTLFAQEGATLAELMRRGGHSDIRIVLRYQHATMTRDRELADRMSARVTARLTAANAKKAHRPDHEPRVHALRPLRGGAAQCSAHQLAYGVVPLSWAPMPEGLDFGTHSYSSQGYLDLRQYKTPEATQAQWRRLRSLFLLAFAKHGECIVPDLTSHPFAITHVPSSSGQRTGTHPLEALLYGNFREDRPRVLPEYVGEVGAGRAQRRQLNPDNWRIDPAQMQGAERVLIFDDTWVTGGHAQSLAAAFARTGVATRVIVLGRALDPTPNDQGGYLETHRPLLFDSSICPVHREPHTG